MKDLPVLLLLYFLSGPIPWQFATRTNLLTLNLDSNKFEGPIPKPLIPKNLPRLILLNLSHNSLQGPIPFGYANFSGNAIQLDLSANNLSGEHRPLSSTIDHRPSTSYLSLPTALHSGL